MHPVVNTAQAEAWNGYEGGHWADHHDRWNAVNGGFDEHLFAAASIGRREEVLDIGCGTGQTTRLAAAQAAEGRALGVDLSGPMLARARALSAEQGLENVSFVQGDAQVHSFRPGGHDVAVSRFATMFFGDPVAAFANIRRALRPGGRLAFACMGDPDRNAWVHVLSGLRAYLPMPGSPAPGEPGMFSLADPALVHTVLTGAGWTEVAATTVEAPMHWGRDPQDAAALLLGSGPGRHLLSQVDEPTARRARAALTDALRPYAGTGGVRLRGSALLVTAVAP
ncbi:class I SAM-dependent methyltransferase [Kitasatospora sp. NBC_00315]|uniref:class I SAM-dependent methyltransferase n=1 Tax=Kitasatospora sp. NBC_00315 TaxID=2975963 RepID=UPI003253E391